ncbi:MAG: hypothetical protein ACNA70_03785 [Brevefilum sp.]
MIRFLVSRLALLLMIIGIIVLAVGVAALQSDLPALNLLAIGAAGTVFGFLLWNRLRKRRPRNSRSVSSGKRERRAQQAADDPWRDRFNE